MPEQTWILDPATGALVVEGLASARAMALAGDLLLTPQDLNCARPLAGILPLASHRPASGASLRVARLYHGSVVDGPGRRSVVQLQGCPILCRGFMYSTAARWWPLRAKRAAGHPAARGRATNYG